MLCLALALSIAGCAEDGSDDRDDSIRDKAPDPSESFEAVEEALSDGRGDIPILGADGEVVEGFENTGLAALITEYVTLDLGEPEVEGDSAFVDAIVTAPDMEKVLREADMAAALAERLPELLKSAPERDFEVQLELRLLDGQWCLVASSELSNALSGGLVEMRAELLRQALEELKKGE